MEIKRYGEKEFLSADKLYIRENEIHIWCIRWSEMTDFWKNHEYILSGQELEQAGRFRFPEDRMRYIAGKVVVRILLKRYLDMETIDFSVNELGKRASLDRCLGVFTLLRFLARRMRTFSSE